MPCCGEWMNGIPVKIAAGLETRLFFGCATALLMAAAFGLGGCASTNMGEVAAPPPPPVFATGQVLADWRAVITADDRRRYQTREQAWTLALEQSRRQKGSGELSALGNLLNPSAALDNAAIPAGNYRCRTVKLGSQSGDDGLGYVVYGWFSCRVERTSQGMRLVKLTGSQRPEGLLYPEDSRHQLFLGSMALSSEGAAPGYGRASDRNIVSVLERIGERRWRLVTPWPRHESNLDVMELVPA